MPLEDILFICDRLIPSLISEVIHSFLGGGFIPKICALFSHLCKCSFKSCGVPCKIKIVSKIPSAKFSPRSLIGSFKSLKIPHSPLIQPNFSFLFLIMLMHVKVALISNSFLQLLFCYLNQQQFHIQHEQ